ncbi:hypothetical protein ACLNGM_15145 [Aureimonas phyllosphaerae]|uniref:hypothetical protein n=1 Tax=Aureimonas phyllosphaerae TaxID=1166078 RepID=UPI003A5C6754
MTAFRSGLDRPVKRSSDRIGGGILGQVWFAGTPVTQVKQSVVPDGAAYAFVEGLGRGGLAFTGGSNPAAAISGGGAGEDAIVAVSPGANLTIDASHAAVMATTITISDKLVLTAASAPDAGNTRGAAGAGKYPGTQGTLSPRVGGNGGGRFGGAGGQRGSSSQQPGAGLGAGEVTTQNGQLFPGGFGVGCVTFFTSYDDALAFAKAVYGSSWVP